jgi:hypothetical protein
LETPESAAKWIEGCEWHRSIKGFCRGQPPRTAAFVNNSPYRHFTRNTLSLSVAHSSYYYFAGQQKRSVLEMPSMIRGNNGTENLRRNLVRTIIWRTILIKMLSRFEDTCLTKALREYTKKVKLMSTKVRLSPSTFYITKISAFNNLSQHPLLINI